MEIIESEMISHPQHVLSSLGQQPWPQGQPGVFMLRVSPYGRTRSRPF